MSFPDQSHINRVRESLWRRLGGGASVMIGAGFSRNSKKIGPHALDFPLWSDISKWLCNRLYPSGEIDHLERAMMEASSTSGFLRLAQEYEAAFGRGSLHRLIQELVPDDDYMPGNMHVRLLRLPWRDVFTTNWDSLLERTRPFITDRAYSVVRTLEEIPSAPSPRIIKLHGSFPAHVPFILTEEDYRRYPKRFAPFVNTVQQAMMESVFCLVGFSGDDPNFLHWSGWVRDNLGESAPKIYLAGWLNLSSHRRRMLEERNVVPIDLSHHPQATKWPEHLRHQYSTEWIIHTLERGRPYDIAEWPSPRTFGHSVVPELLQPVEDEAIDAPIAEPRPPARSANPTSLPVDLRAQVNAVIRAWEHNRKVYPGWLLIPPNSQVLIGMNMNDWEPVILQVLPELSFSERLSTIWEFVWRREHLLEPLSAQIEAETQTILDNIDCQKRKISGIECISAPWANIRERWRDLALILLTAARQHFDRDAFDRHLSTLLPFLDDHPDVAQRVYHEKCLWALYACDYRELEKFLKEWQPEDCDPMWMTRKAAILVEMDRNDDAVRLLNSCLSILREAPLFARTLASPSREGWTLCLALAYEKNFLGLTGESIEGVSPFERWTQLAPLQCDARAQKRDFRDRLLGDPEEQDGPLFDLGARRGRTIRTSNAEYRRWIMAQRAVRLCEVAGMPPSAYHMVVGGDILTLAADHLITTNYALASRLVLRLAKSEDDAAFNRVWGRSRIAAMSSEEVDAMIDVAKNIITYSLPRASPVNTRSIFWVTRLRIGMEALSRLVLRLDPERAKDTFKQGLAYYRKEEIAKDHWLATPINNLLSRSWNAIPEASRADLMFDVLAAPIMGLDEFKGIDRDYPDPWNLLDRDNPALPARTLETEEWWNRIVQMIVRGLHCVGEGRTRAAERLVTLALWGQLTESENALIAQALWHPDHTSPNTLPSDTHLCDWVFLLLPEPELGAAEQRFRKKWLSAQQPKEESGLNEFLWHVGHAIDALRHYGQPLKLTAEEQANLVAVVENWITSPITTDEHPFVRYTRSHGIEGLQFILPEVELSSAVAELLLSKAVTLNRTLHPAFRLFAGLTKFLPNHLDEVTRSLRIGLASDTVAVAEEAVVGLEIWLKVSLDKAYSVPVPPNDLVREIGVMIATRRKGVLIHALKLARSIYSWGLSEQRDTVTPFALQGLSYLIEELRYERVQGENDLDTPLLRWGCAHLALAMAESGYKANQTVAHWIGVAANDPLPEVRYAEGSIINPAIKYHEMLHIGQPND